MRVRFGPNPREWKELGSRILKKTNRPKEWRERRYKYGYVSLREVG